MNLCVNMRISGHDVTCFIQLHVTWYSETVTVTNSCVCQPPVDASLHLPSSVFGSTVETKVGLLNRAAPMPGTRMATNLNN